MIIQQRGTLLLKVAGSRTVICPGLHNLGRLGQRAVGSKRNNRRLTRAMGWRRIQASMFGYTTYIIRFCWDSPLQICPARDGVYIICYALWGNN